jgi:large subunit ribosomal protein L9
MMAKKKGKGGGGGSSSSGSVQVVLSAPVKGVGKKGELVTVKAAYAENFLIRGGLGVKATPDVLKNFEAEQAAAVAAAEAAKQRAVEASETLKKVFSEGAMVKKNVGPDGALFGSVTASELATLIEDQAGIKVEKKDIQPPDLKKVGTGTAEITLHKEVVSKLKVVVAAA